MAEASNLLSQGNTNNEEIKSTSIFSQTYKEIHHQLMNTESERAQSLAFPRPDRRLFRPEEVAERMRKKAFIQWINFILRTSEYKIEKLEIDLQDGKIIILLLEALYETILVPERSHLDLKQGSPNYSQERLANIKTALSFVHDRLGIDIAVTPQDINHGNVQQMLALLWALIQRVELTERGMNEESLLRWIQSRVTSPHAQINSFADCLREPQFLAAFINSFTEGSAVVFAVPSSQPTLKEMMQIAEQRLGIPVALDAHLLEMNPQTVDIPAVVTYFSFFLHLDKARLLLLSYIRGSNFWRENPNEMFTQR